jgi:pilus assembly protein CpaB
MNGRSIVVLALAVVIGLGAMVLTRQMMSKGGSKEEPTQEVLVAARDFKEEEALKPDMVKVIRMAKSAVPPNAYTSFKDVEDRWIRTTMLEGDVLVEKKLGPKGTPPGLVANIPKGMRAFAIDVTEQSGVSGFILPGHHVDVIRHDSNEKNEHRAEMVLQNVLVLAAGQVFTRPEERAVQSRTVTLAVTPAQVDIVVVARARGSLSLALRGVNDHDVVVHAPAKPPVDPEHEKRLKVEEEKRSHLEVELRELKEALARKAAEPPPPPPPAPKPRKAPRIATIYRANQPVQRIRTDMAQTAELEPAEPAPFPVETAGRLPMRPSPPPVVAAGDPVTGP